ncbi:MAG: rhodanese-like domain-containing protein [Balneolaceae bacterium]|nr:rhodanese-like domain-containing protein [Balneolaceae bacterium]
MEQYSERFIVLVNDAENRIEQISPQQLYEKLDDADDEVRIFDIRPQEKWKSTRIAGAEHLNRGIIEREIHNHIKDPEQEFILYSEEGHLSALAADNLQKMGYHHVKILKGGFRAWNEAGLPFQKEEA